MTNILNTLDVNMSLATPPFSAFSFRCYRLLGSTEKLKARLLTRHFDSCSAHQADIEPAPSRHAWRIIGSRAWPFLAYIAWSQAEPAIHYCEEEISSASSWEGLGISLYFRE